jgi:hypothetical protein
VVSKVNSVHAHAERKLWVDIRTKPELKVIVGKVDVILTNEGMLIFILPIIQPHEAVSMF